MIGNKRQKVCLINQGIVGKLLAILNDEGQDDSVRIESVIVLGSLAKGQDDHVYSILSSGAIETLIRGMCLIFACIFGAWTYIFACGWEM